MPRGRMISKSISRSERIAELPIEGQLLFTWLIPHTDVEGRLNGDVWAIKAIVPYVTKITPKNIPKLLIQMEKIGLISYYGNKHKYIQILNFDKYQSHNKDREAESGIPSVNTKELLRNSGGTPEKIPAKLNKTKLNETKGNDSSYVSKGKIEELCEKRLGKLANADDIVKVLKELPEAMWWMVDKYLNFKYPEDRGKPYKKAVEVLNAM